MPTDSSIQCAESSRSTPVAGEIKVLLVDDQPARLMAYETILDGLGYGLVHATSGLQALEQLMKEEFAVILLDVSMPGMDGFETASLIHEHPRFERTPIIFVTGVNVSELDQLKGYKLGAVDYVHVPVVPEILRSKLAAANRSLQLDKARELEALNRDLKRANVELATANRALHAEVEMRARIEEQLKAADRHKDEFLAMLAHELRNPLAPIRNAVHIMRAKPTADAQLTWVQDVIDRQLASLTRLVDDLLDVSRITRGKINIAREPVALGAIVQSAVETVQPLFSEKQQRLTIDVADPAVTIDGDLTRLTQVVGNILANAVKYTDRGGHVTVIARQVGEDVEIRVRDDGIGIAAEDLVRIFDLFTQAEQSHQRGLGGLGIGLALVRRLVELHGGTVAAASDGPGRGSEIIVCLPRRAKAARNTAPQTAAPWRGEPAGIPAPLTGSSLAPDTVWRPSEADREIPMPKTHAPETRWPETRTTEAGMLEAASDGRHPGSSRTGRRILIVDDNRDALESLAALLEMSGHEVHVAADGEAALQVAEDCTPEVVLLDLGLPKLDGYEVARRLRETPWGKAAVIIALTGWGQDEDRRRTRASGFDSHMVKPLDLDALTRMLHVAGASSSAAHDVTHS